MDSSFFSPSSLGSNKFIFYLLRILDVYNTYTYIQIQTHIAQNQDQKIPVLWVFPFLSGPRTRPVCATSRPLV